MIDAANMEVLRELAGRYSEIAHLDIQKQRLERYARSNDLEVVRPVVLIDEVPWGEIRDDALKCVCVPELQWLEGAMRRALYQWEHFQVDTVIPPVFRVGKRSRSTGIGIDVQEVCVQGDTGAYISSHRYSDQLATDADLDKLHPPEIAYDRDATEAAMEQATAVLDGLMEVELHGHAVSYHIWDMISVLRGVDALLMDLAGRPDFMHRTLERFVEIAEAQFRQYEDLGLLDPDQILLHCTPACTRDLPPVDPSEKASRRHVWGRCSAQIFSAVSPAMHDEFDLAYNQRLFGDCGLLYYGCCEPLDMKVDILRKRFSNLRKVAITPWADAAKAAESIGPDYVLGARPNPAAVAHTEFGAEPVAKEISRYCEVCLANRTPLEFVLKDISTIANDPQNLTLWAATVNSVVDRYYGE
ncbi:MAG TPA: hypothetical protein DGT21_01815 [Armatimonadetes bacterium]|jgi:hypothetical protein|nr:hypothetical protein [Armatimonadota bacterium]